MNAPIRIKHLDYLFEHEGCYVFYHRLVSVFFVFGDFEGKQDYFQKCFDNDYGNLKKQYDAKLHSSNYSCGYLSDGNIIPFHDYQEAIEREEMSFFEVDNKKDLEVKKREFLRGKYESKL